MFILFRKMLLGLGFAIFIPQISFAMEKNEDNELQKRIVDLCKKSTTIRFDSQEFLDQILENPDVPFANLILLDDTYSPLFKGKKKISDEEFLKIYKKSQNRFPDNVSNIPLYMSNGNFIIYSHFIDSDESSLQPLYCWKAHCDRLRSVNFSPSKNFLVTATSNEIKIWHAYAINTPDISQKPDRIFRVGIDNNSCASIHFVSFGQNDQEIIIVYTNYIQETWVLPTGE